MSLLERLGLKLAMKWLRGKLARAKGRIVLKFLDGNKRLIFVLVFLASGLLKLATGQDIDHLLGGLFQLVGWNDPASTGYASQFATVFAPLIFALWAAAHALWKAWKQWKAGATLTEVNSTAGIVKLAAAEGTLSELFPPPGERDRRAWKVAGEPSSPSRLG